MFTLCMADSKTYFSLQNVRMLLEKQPFELDANVVFAVLPPERPDVLDAEKQLLPFL